MSRIASIQHATQLDTTVTGIPSFELSSLELPGNLDVELPNNLRLGHLAEKVFSTLVKASTNYQILAENIQIGEGSKTIGELDFILQKKDTREVTHVELAYKFYLFDPSLSDDPVHCWIGPNRNDSLIEKLSKLKGKQFPLLHDSAASSHIQNILGHVDMQHVSQALCLLASLYVPFGYEASFGESERKAIKGFYLGIEKAKSIDSPLKTYYLPTKKEWGMEPAEHSLWNTFEDIEPTITERLSERRAVMVWQKEQDAYSSFFVVWW